MLGRKVSHAAVQETVALVADVCYPTAIASDSNASDDEP
jgi:hypothetical protein